MSRTAKPLLLIDVDGPLNPWRLITERGYRRPCVPANEPAYTYTRHDTRPSGWETGDPLPVLLSPAHGEELNALADVFTLIWATSWQDQANTWIGPKLGLRNLPAIYWPDEADTWTSAGPGRPRHQAHQGSWKTKHIAAWLDAYAPGVPWAWVDDEVNRFDRAWLTAHHTDVTGKVSGSAAVPHLLLNVDARQGLRPTHFDQLCTWANQLS